MARLEYTVVIDCPFKCQSCPLHCRGSFRTDRITIDVENPLPVAKAKPPKEAAVNAVKPLPWPVSDTGDKIHHGESVLIKFMVFVCQTMLCTPIVQVPIRTYSLPTILL